MQILIGADIVPVESNMKLFELGVAEKLVDAALLNVLQQADYRIFNLEVPLTDSETPIFKCGPALIASTESARGIRALGADFMTMANNHIMDQGEQGLYSSMETLDRLGIAHAGAGADLSEAKKPFILERDGKRVGIYCCAEHEFSIADEHKAGANPFDPLESLDHISALRTQCDYVIVLYHGGKEQYRYPSPCLQKVCRKIVEKGADLVICQHTHCIGCEEKYQGGTIVYGQGNFLFDDSESEYWKTSLLVGVNIESSQVEISYIPLMKDHEKVRLSTGKDRDDILEQFSNRSNCIKKEAFVQKQWELFAENNINMYLSAGVPCSKSFFFRAINLLTGKRIYRKLLGNTHKLLIQNYLKCETHRELFLTGLENERNRFKS